MLAKVALQVSFHSTVTTEQKYFTLKENRNAVPT